MKVSHSFGIMLLLAGASASTHATAGAARTGPGAMPCTPVIGRLSSKDSLERMVVSSWVQGYLSGLVSAKSAAAATTAASVPEYDALQPRILELCKADPTTDLYHVASRV